jgi:hypothetical protein
VTLLNTTTDLIQQVRDISDEDNVTDISDALVIRMLNRAQQEMNRILVKRYPNYYMKETIYTGSDLAADANSQTRVLTLDDQSFAFSINQIDAKIGTSWFPVRESPFFRTLGFDAENSTTLPITYSVNGNKLHFFPAPKASTSIRIRYQFRAPQITSLQGRITAFSIANGTMTIDSVGSDLSTSVDTLGAFINVVDHLTGRIKATVQVTGINTTTKVLTIQTTSGSLDRTEVFGYTVGAAVPSDIAKDDYVCSAVGTCVPFLGHDLSNFLVDIAGWHVKRKLGTIEPSDTDERNSIIKAIESLPFGREYTKQIKRTRANTDWPYSQQWFFQGS